jgi:tetratricopeptide (TPR) repeat protein
VVTGSNRVVLVTGRRQPADLIARHGARLLRLDLLDDVEAAAVSELLACCAGLPLAISNVATRATLRPSFPLAVFADELRDVSSRLDTLDDGELATNVRTVLSWSYNALDQRAAAVFRLLGAGVGRRPARHCRTGRPSGGSAGSAPAAGRTGAALAGRALPVHRQPGAGVGVVTTERRNLLAAQSIAADNGWHAAACAVAWTLETGHRRRGHINEAVKAWQVGLAAAERLGDQAHVAVARRLLGTAYARAGRYTEAFVNLRQALVLSELSDDLLGQAHAHHLMAGAWDLRREDKRALDHASRALPLFAELDLPVRQAWALDQIGWHEAQLGDYEPARTHCEAALVLARAHHDREGEAVTLDSLGYILGQTGRYTEAAARYREALDLFRELADTYEEAVTLDSLAEALHALGDVHQATEAWLQALDLCRFQHRTAEADRIRLRLDGVDHAGPDGGPGRASVMPRFPQH